MRNSTMHCQKPRRRRVDCPVRSKVKGTGDGNAKGSRKNPGKERVNPVGVGLLAIYGFKENVEVSEKTMETLSKSDGIAWSVNIDTFNHMFNAVIKHVKHCERSFFRRILK